MGRVWRRGGPVVGLVLVGVLVGMGVPAGPAAAGSGWTVAEVTLHATTRVVVTAARVGGGGQGAPVATAWLVVDQRDVGGRWRLGGRRVVGRAGGVVLAGAQRPGGGVCGGPGGAGGLRVGVSLRYGPSAGCSPVYRYHLHDGRLVGG
jgi:hypothetical protein